MLPFRDVRWTRNNEHIGIRDPYCFTNIYHIFWENIVISGVVFCKSTLKQKNVKEAFTNGHSSIKTFFIRLFLNIIDLHKMIFEHILVLIKIVTDITYTVWCILCQYGLLRAYEYRSVRMMQNIITGTAD